MLWLGACQTEEECIPTPCALPPAEFDTVNIVLLDENCQIIELTEAMLEQISFNQGPGFSEKLTLNDHVISVHLSAINQNIIPSTEGYTLSTPFGADQELLFVVESKEDEDRKCSFCPDFFIRLILQNGEDNLFYGDYHDELISIKIN